jgi:hypothetical protein
MSSPENQNDRIGYGRPPKQYQFPANQSGNPAGRPKANRSVNARMNRELTTLTEARSGRERIVLTKKRAIVRSTIKRALAGDVRAAAIGLERARAHNPAEKQLTVCQYGNKKWVCGTEEGEGMWWDTHEWP